MIKSVTIKNRKTGQILFKILERKNGKVELTYLSVDKDRFDFDIRDERNQKMIFGNDK